MEKNKNFYVMNATNTYGKYKTLKGAKKGLQEAKELWDNGWGMIIIQGGISLGYRRTGIRHHEVQKRSALLTGVEVF